MISNKKLRFELVKPLIDNEIFDEDQDYELATILLGQFTFIDRQAIEFSLRILRHDQANLPLIITQFNNMLKQMGSE